MDLKSYIETIPNHPVSGVNFRDIQPLLADPLAFELTIHELSDMLEDFDFDYVVGIESRGFIIGQALAWVTNKGFKLIRKFGKLPPVDLHTYSYDLEYGEDIIQMKQGTGKVVVVDDVYATGGTMKAAKHLCVKSGYKVVDTLCLIDAGLVKDHSTKCLFKF